MTEGTALRASVVIPTIGRGDLVLRTIEALLAQSHVEEIIVVDQTLKHDPADRARLEGLVAAGKIRWVMQPEPSASKARNMGIALARAPIVLFLDDDVELGPSFVARHVERYHDSSVDFVCGQIRPPDGRVRFSRHPLSRLRHVGWLYFPLNYVFRTDLCAGGAGNLSVRTRAARFIGGMDENFAKGAHREEADFCLRLEASGYRGVFEPCATIRTLAHPTGGIRSWGGDATQPAFHHLVGEWYFTFQHLSLRTVVPFIVAAVQRQFLKQVVRRPWRAPLALLRMLEALVRARRMVRHGRALREEWGD